MYDHEDFINEHIEMISEWFSKEPLEKQIEQFKRQLKLEMRRASNNSDQFMLEHQKLGALQQKYDELYSENCCDHKLSKKVEEWVNSKPGIDGDVSQCGLGTLLPVSDESVNMVPL